LTNTSANGSTSDCEVSTFVDAGYDFRFGDLSFGPLFAAQYTNVHVDGFTERGSFLPLNIHSDSEESWRTDLGMQASYAWNVGNDNLQFTGFWWSLRDGFRPARGS
jgi:outer membrane autotransporter protein